jgi:hypothetical protein
MLIRVANSAVALGIGAASRLPMILLVALSVCGASSPGTHDKVALTNSSDAKRVEAASTAGESYTLPISRPTDQGDSDLCWVFATLSMLETNYRYRHPGSGIELSRGALQRQSIADRFRRMIHGSAAHLEDGGVAVDAIALIREAVWSPEETFTNLSIPSGSSHPSRASYRISQASKPSRGYWAMS